MKKLFKHVASLVGTGARAFVALIGVAGITVAVANYTMTQGAGTTFASVVISTVHYAAQVICDATNGATQCAAVDSSGNVSVKDTTVHNDLVTLNTTAGNPLTAQSPAVPIGGIGICDGANGATNPCTTAATVKAASTPTVSTDKAVVADSRPATPATPLVATASDNHAVLKNGAGIAMSVHTSNNSATKNYLRLYDAGTGFNGCNSATGVIFAMEIPPTDSGFTVSLGGGAGISFVNGLSWCITSGFGLTDTTAATATSILANASFR